MSSGNDPYTAKAVRHAAATLGYWLVAASLVHAVIHPIMCAAVATVVAQYVASQASSAMQEVQAEMKRQQLERVNTANRRSP